MDAGTVGALGAALKLKVYTANRRFRHAFLPEEAQLPAIQYCTRRVRTLWFDLYWIFKVHMERVARAVGKELCVILRQNIPKSLEFYFNIVISSAGRTPI